MKFSRIARRALIVLSFGGMVTTFGGQSAEAATQTFDLDISATVLTSCTIATLPVNFGTYNPMGAQATAPLDNSAGVVDVACANGLAVTVRLDEGLAPATGSSPTAPLRQMTDAVSGDVLAYNLYSDAPGGAVWDFTGIPDIGDGTHHLLSVYGRIPAGQHPQPGTYGDTVTATVEF